MLEKLEDILPQIEDSHRRFELVELIHTRIGGWRGLFDPFADEWKKTEISRKVEIIGRIIRETGVPLEEIVRLYKNYFEAHHRPDIANCADVAVAQILQWMILRHTEPR